MWHNYSQSFVIEMAELGLGFLINQRVNGGIGNQTFSRPHRLVRNEILQILGCRLSGDDLSGRYVCNRSSAVQYFKSRYNLASRSIAAFSVSSFFAKQKRTTR